MSAGPSVATLAAYVLLTNGAAWLLHAKRWQLKVWWILKTKGYFHLPCYWQLRYECNMDQFIVCLMSQVEKWRCIIGSIGSGLFINIGERYRHCLEQGSYVPFINFDVRILDWLQNKINAAFNVYWLQFILSLKSCLIWLLLVSVSFKIKPW